MLSCTENRAGTGMNPSDWITLGAIFQSLTVQFDGEGGMAAARRRRRLRRCPARTGSEVLNHTRREMKNGATRAPFSISGGEGGIRTHERLLTFAGFQDQCIQPLCHLSGYSCLVVIDQCIDSRHPWRSPFGRAARVPIGILPIGQPLCHLSCTVKMRGHCACSAGPIQLTDIERPEIGAMTRGGRGILGEPRGARTV